MLVTAGRRSRCAGDCGAPIEAEELVEYRQGERARHIVCPSAAANGPVTPGARDNGVTAPVTSNGIANGHAPVPRDSSVTRTPVTRDQIVGHDSPQRDIAVSHGSVTRDSALNKTVQDNTGEDRRGGSASPIDGAGAPDAADRADELLAEYERTVLPSLQRIGDGTFTVELDGPNDYVTFTLAALRDDPEAQRAVPLADSKHSLSHDGVALFRSFAIVKGRRVMPVRRLVADARPEVQRPLRRLLLGLEAVMRSSDGAMRYGLAYARQAQRCFRCGETLSTPVSLNRGIGPKCLKKFLKGE